MALNIYILTLNMLLNISYNDIKQKKEIDKLVGKPFSIKERLKMGGIGSEKLIISSASINIKNLLLLDNNINKCNIELRPKGIIVFFRSLLETYGLIIPYFKLKIYKGKAEEYSIYKDSLYIKVLADKKSIHKFFKKIIKNRLENSLPSIDE